MTPEGLYEQLIKEVEQTQDFDIQKVLDFIDRAHYLGAWKEKEAINRWLDRQEKKNDGLWH